MPASGGGAIVNVSSVNGLTAAGQACRTRAAQPRAGLRTGDGERDRNQRDAK
jgi:NAD(P)-dependent dehydrogenase (short-subunit alcohol dehydrogenase family)